MVIADWTPAVQKFVPTEVGPAQVHGAGKSVHFFRSDSGSDAHDEWSRDSQFKAVLDRLTDVLNDQRHRLPEIFVTKFGGDPLEYARFVRAFDSRIASRTRDHGELLLLYYLEQYTTGAPKELVRSCVHKSPVAGYMEARRKLDMRYGDPFLLVQSYLKKLDID